MFALSLETHQIILRKSDWILQDAEQQRRKEKSLNKLQKYFILKMGRKYISTIVDDDFEWR